MFLLLLLKHHFVEDFSDYKGSTISFKIVELEKEKNRLILISPCCSRGRKRQEEASTLLESLERCKFLKELYSDH